MQPYGDNFTLVIPMEDDYVHTDDKRFCGDPTCNCTEEPDLINA
jgi:hypothetical protein